MITERSLDPEELAELVDAASSLEVSGEARFEDLGASPDDELAFAFAAWWGGEVARLTGWTWVGLTLPGAVETPGLVSSDRSVAVLPFQLVALALDGDRDARATLDDTLGRLGRGDRPRGAPGSYALVG